MPGSARRIALSGVLLLITAASAGFSGDGLAAPGTATGVPRPVMFTAAGGPWAGRASWCQPERVYSPSGRFRPLQAPGSELLANGFPPRPSRSDQSEFRMWQDVVRHARVFVPPRPVCGPAHRGTVYSDNWAGHVVPRSLFGGPFTAVQAEWVQPAVPANPAFGNANSAPTASFWVGIGVRNLIQAGVDSIATRSPTYRFWTEDYPRNMVWEGPSIGPGQTAFVYIDYLGDKLAYYFLENVSTGRASAFTNAAPFVGADAVNFVNERPNRLYLPRFGSVRIRNARFWRGGSSFPLTAANDKWYMTSNCAGSGAGLSVPSAVSTGSFAQVWYRGRPFVNSC